MKVSRLLTENTVFSVFGKLDSNFIGDINLVNEHLRTLHGSPETVSGNFSCNNNFLQNLDFAPKKVGEDFLCDHNSLKSLKGCPIEVGGDLVCAYNNMLSLEGCPTNIGGNLDCYENVLTSLDGLPSFIGGHLFLGSNKLESLEGIHKRVKTINGGYADFVGNPIKSHVLGLLRIAGLNLVDLPNEDAQGIINYHLKNGKDIFACQEELVEAGLEEFAQL